MQANNRTKLNEYTWADIYIDKILSEPVCVVLKNNIETRDKN